MGRRCSPTTVGENLSGSPAASVGAAWTAEEGQPMLLNWWWGGVAGSFGPSRQSSVVRGPMCCHLTPQVPWGTARFRGAGRREPTTMLVKWWVGRSSGVWPLCVRGAVACVTATAPWRSPSRDKGERTIGRRGSPTTVGDKLPGRGGAGTRCGRAHRRTSPSPRSFNSPSTARCRARTKCMGHTTASYAFRPATSPPPDGRSAAAPSARSRSRTAASWPSTSTTTGWSSPSSCSQATV